MGDTEAMIHSEANSSAAVNPWIMCFQNTMVKQAQTDILIPKGRNRKEEEWHLKGQTALKFQAPEKSFFGCIPVLIVWLWSLLLSSHGLASCACDSPRWQFCLCCSSLLELHPCSSLDCNGEQAALLVCTLSWPCILQSSLQGPNLWNLGEGSLAHGSAFVLKCLQRRFCRHCQSVLPALYAGVAIMSALYWGLQSHSWTGWGVAPEAGSGACHVRWC